MPDCAAPHLLSLVAIQDIPQRVRELITTDLSKLAVLSLSSTKLDHVKTGNGLESVPWT